MKAENILRCRIRQIALSIHAKHKNSLLLYYELPAKAFLKRLYALEMIQKQGTLVPSQETLNVITCKQLLQQQKSKSVIKKKESQKLPSHVFALRRFCCDAAEHCVINGQSSRKFTKKEIVCCLTKLLLGNA